MDPLYDLNSWSKHYRDEALREAHRQVLTVIQVRVTNLLQPRREEGVRNCPGLKHTERKATEEAE